MKFQLLLLVVMVSVSTTYAERVSNNLINYDPPGEGWKVEVDAKRHTAYTKTNPQTGTYCQIFVTLGINSSGTITKDFEKEWKSLIVSSYKITGTRKILDSDAEPGWKARTGFSSFAFNGSTSMAMLTTISGSRGTTSIVVVTNSEEYAPAIEGLLASVKMNEIEAAKPQAKKGTAKPTALQGYMDYNPLTQQWTWRLRLPPPK